MNHTAPNTQNAKWYAIGLALVFPAGTLFRIACSNGELWLDELWSLIIVLKLDSPGKIFTGLHHENNHYLVSLWVWACGWGHDAWVYRLPSIVAGAASVAIAFKIGVRQSRASGMIFATLISFSYLSVFYSSEARGYAIACCMLLAAYDSLDLFLEQRHARHAVWYWIAVLTGILGSLTFVTVFAALVAWSAAGLIGKERSSDSIRQFVLLNALPALAVAGLWLLDIRSIINGGGPKVGIWAILTETAGYAFGLPHPFPVAGAVTIAMLVFVVWQSASMGISRDSRAVFFATAIILAPAALLIATGRMHVYPRYFLVNIFPFYLLVAIVAGRVWDNAGQTARYVIACGLALWIMGNSLLNLELLQVGRGRYREAMAFISAQTTDNIPRIGAIHTFRTTVLAGYYGQYFPNTKQPDIIAAPDVSRERPEWLLATTSPYEGKTDLTTLNFAPGLTYELVKQFPSVRLSGFPAGVYRRIDY